jgi:hypothetical protein
VKAEYEGTVELLAQLLLAVVLFPLLSDKKRTQDIQRFRTPETRFHLSTEARNTIQEAALNVQTAQAMLPGVQFPYCTAREMTAVLQVGTVKQFDCAL